MSDYWLEPIDYAERRALGILCPFCRDESDKFEDEPKRLKGGDVIHRYRRGGFESCVKSEAASLIRTALDEAARVARDMDTEDVDEAHAAETARAYGQPYPSIAERIADAIEALKEPGQ